MIANKLNYGDTIGVVGVSNSLKLHNRYEQFLKAEDMMNMFKDKEVKAIICLEGGQTCNTFIDLLDYEIIKQNPKIIIGYSDITVLLQTMYKKTGLITFHGSSFICFGEDDAEEKYKEFESTFVNKKIGKFKTGAKKVIRRGNAEGKIIGTNLGCMMYLLGTEYLPDMQDKILLIESYETSPNQCHRRFAHLKQYGIFDKIKGIIIGYNYDLQKNGDIFPQMEDILLEYTREYDFPIIKCNDFGHKIVNSVIPIGANCRIDSNNEKVEIIEQFLTE